MATDVNAGSIKSIHPLEESLKDAATRTDYLDRVKSTLGIDDIVSFDELTKEQRKKIRVSFGI